MQLNTWKRLSQELFNSEPWCSLFPVKHTWGSFSQVVFCQVLVALWGLEHTEHLWCSMAKTTQGPLIPTIYANFAACLLEAMFLARLEGNFNLNTLSMREIYDWCRWYFQQQDDGRWWTIIGSFEYFQDCQQLLSNLAFKRMEYQPFNHIIFASCFCCTLDLSWFLPHRSGNHWITTGRCMESWAHSDGGVEVMFYVRAFLTLFRR